ncbi:restriction endonuclease subunit S [Tenacibaculum dicentrarchi]|uniref:restriction endonuclease subunit S n=1 Tax=Tenacibaculum dicentrarchi TaxID=669041 RepID=UPI000C7E27DF|nr:Restriction modification system DNA specificity domain protein [Tenacibaculum dicentrarchi]
MQLLKHFKELTVNSKNAKELKGLILQLAIQGKLTANWRKENTNIESASELLKKIQKEKERLIKEKKIRKEKSLPVIVKNETTFEIPSKWKWYRLRDVGLTMTGGTPSKSNSNFFGNDIPFLKPGDIKDWKVNYENEGLSFLGEQKLGRTAISGSVLMVCLGTIGKCAIINRACSFNQQINSITPLMISSSYLLNCLSSKYFYDVAWAKSTSTTIALLNKGKWESIPIPIPPLEEQKEIVKIVETLFKEVDKLEQLTVARISLKEDFVRSALKELTNNNTKKEWDYLQEHFKSFFNETTNIKKLRETVLQLAVQGKLTADWRANNPSTEDATILLKRIQKEKTQLIEDKKIKKEKILPKITKEEIPYKLPKSWVWCRMIELCQYITDGTHQTPKYTEEGRMFISAKNVKPFKFMPEKHRFVSDEDFEGYRRNRKPELNDILLTRVGAGIGEATLIDQDLEFAIYVSVGLLKMFPNKLKPNYIVMWLNSPEGRQYSSKNTYGKGVSQGNLNLSLIRQFVVSLPPLEEQKAIVEKVNALMSLCDKLEQEVQQSEAHSTQLMKSCLKEVFVG